MTLLQHIEVKSFYEKSYGHDGFDAQRRYPNEELCRFMGRHYFPIPLEERRNVRILEVGCGSGANLWMIAREGFDAHGLDLSEEAIRLSARMLQHYKTKATLSIGDMMACPFPDEYFDAVVDIFSAYCLDEVGFAFFLAEVRRLLKPRGRMFSYTPSKASDAFRNHAPARLIDASTLDGIRRPDSPFSGNLYPFRFIDKESYAAAIAEHSLEVTYCETVARTYNGGREYFEFVVVAAQRPA
jgi:SAM-dependent methyltransferase